MDELRLDDAARAGWLYYIAGNTQDDIARKLSISRQSAQRLVALAVSRRLVKVRLDHPIAVCMRRPGWKAMPQAAGTANSRAVPFGRMGRPEDHVGCAIFLASADSDYVVAQTFNVDGGQWMS